MWHAGRCAATAAALLAGFLVACASREEQFADYMASAVALASEGENEQAILEYRSALRLDPDSGEANEKLGELLLRRADLSAVYYLGEAIRLDPSRIDLAMRLAWVLLASHQVDDAERVIEAALAVHPKAAVVHGAKAELLLYRNDPTQALEAAVEATKLGPEDPNSWYQVGRVLEGQLHMARLTKTDPEPGLRRKAIAAFARADEIAGGMVMARVERARLLGMSRDDFQAAKDGFIDAIELAKKQDDKGLQFVAAEFAAQFAAKATKRRFQIWALSEMVAADPDRLDVWLDLVQVVDATSGLGASVFESLLSVRPDDVPSHLAYVSYLTEAGDHRNAMKHLTEVIDRDLDSPLPREQMIRIQIQRGRIANARASYVRMSDEFPDDPVTQRTEARIALAEGRSSDAVEILRPLTADAGSFDHLRLLALAEYRSGNLERASDAINNALGQHRDFSPEALRLKTRIHHDSEEWAATLRSLARLANRGQAISDGEMLMGARAHYGLDRAERGRAVLEVILKGENPPVEAAVEFARREGPARLPEATAYLESALAKDPNNVELLEALVGLDLRADRAPLALRRINRVVESGRAKPATLLLRAHVLTKTGDLERAEADALRAFEADPSLPDGVELLFDIYKAQGRIEEARSSFEEAEAAGVLHSGARLLLGRIYLYEGNTDRARAMFETVIKEDPAATAAKNDLAYLLALNGVDLNRAVQLAQESQREKAGDPDTADTLGFVYLRKGLHEAALNQFQAALELNGDRPGRLAPMLHYHLGLTLHAMDRNQEAIAAFEKALALDSDFTEAVDARRQLEEARRSPPLSTSTS